MQSSLCICVALGVIEGLWYSYIFHRLDRLLLTIPRLNTIASWQWESKMADTNPPGPIPLWFIASIAAVLVIIIVELATVGVLAILIYRNWRWDDAFWVFLLFRLLAAWLLVEDHVVWLMWTGTTWGQLPEDYGLCTEYAQSLLQTCFPWGPVLCW